MIPRHIDQRDLLLLHALQEEFPLVHNPWENIGNQIGMSGEEVLKRITMMETTGTLRGISPTLESAKRGTIVSTLIALRVPEERISDIATVINGYREVSHNFRRDHEFNLWFTLAADSTTRLNEITLAILAETGVHPEDMLDLKTRKRFKIDVKFPLTQRPDGGE
ncbi:MAG: Lrp/AsnC family transcriptional regulator [Methanospirillum sp.]|uniref:Lrp/AsnC family transcriptional regulator n=1 Tax=Methanospirillum sp. TaxID=45200 RepID=UPI00236B189C|nr:Lrp/AsnC family transcriptional regulator [Methanospirillum sp.]MDD1728872.1 Lrp/AsnC family transcriptional regulator [Methanospirillum sp.]